MPGCCVKLRRAKPVVWVRLHVIASAHWGKWRNCNDATYKLELHAKKSSSARWCNGLLCLANSRPSRHCSCNFPWTAHNASFLISCCKYKGDIVLIIILDLNDGTISYEVILWDWYITCCCVLGTDENFSVELNI